MSNKGSQSSQKTRKFDIDDEIAIHNEKVKELIELEKQRRFNAKPIEPKVHTKLKCIQCDQSIQNNLTNCKSCRKNIYCSETCRKTHWQTHKRICELNPRLELLSR